MTEDDRRWLAEILGKAETNLTEASKIRGLFELNDVRPPRSGVEYGGLPAIDLCGRLQQVRLLRAEQRKDAGAIWQALALADEAKGRFFQRDLSIMAAPAPDRDVMSAATLADLRAALVSGLADHRVVMAELAHTLRHEMPAEEAAKYRADTRFDQALTRDEIDTLLQADGVATGLIFFYATARETLVYVVTPGAAVPSVVKLEIAAATVERASARWQGDLRSHAPSDDRDAGLLVEALRRLFEHLLPRMLGVARIALCAHGPWHGVPIHMVLLEQLWQHDSGIGIVHVPSVRAWQLLRRRRLKMAPHERRPIALTTAPAREDIEVSFADAHGRLHALLGRTGRGVSDAFAPKATVRRALDDLRGCGIHHILAHGVDAGVDEAMSSGVLLASESSGLPSRIALQGQAASPRLASDRRAGDAPRDTVLTAALMMANGSVASHVTLQACSIGRPATALRDELWGVTRALLAGGANTVLAPLWDLDLHSSSQLLCRFYESWLLDGQPPWLALARAQREMAEGSIDAFRDFPHWAALQLVGT